MSNVPSPTPVEAELKLVELCESLVMQGDFLAKNDLVALMDWFRTYGSSNIPALANLGVVLRRIVADREATVEEQAELMNAIEGVVTPEVRMALQAKQ